MESENLKTLTVPKVAELLGIHRVRCYQLIKEGKIPAIHMGKSIRVREISLLNWMNTQEQQGTDILS